MQVLAVTALGVARDGVVDELARGGGGLEGGLAVRLGGLVPVLAELGGDLGSCPYLARVEVGQVKGVLGELYTTGLVALHEEGIVVAL